MGLGAATPAHRGALLWLLTWHCHLPLLAAQMTASGAEDAAALREAKAAADTSACHGWDPGPQSYTGPCPLDSWGAVGTAPCDAGGWDSSRRGWVGVQCDRHGGRVVKLIVAEWNIGGELLPFFGRLGALLVLDLHGNSKLRGDVADLAGATELRELHMMDCPLVVGEAAALAALVHLGEDCSLCGAYGSGPGELWLAGSGVYGSVLALRALPYLGPDWGPSDGSDWYSDKTFTPCSAYANACAAAGKTPVAVSPNAARTFPHPSSKLKAVD